MIQRETVSAPSGYNVNFDVYLVLNYDEYDFPEWMGLDRGPFSTMWYEPVQMDFPEYMPEEDRIWLRPNTH